MTTDSLKLYKLIILYFLSRSNQEMTNAILSDFILEYGYTDYLSIQETLNALTEDGLIHMKQTKSTAWYSITDSGRETLQYFTWQLPSDTIRQIENYLQQHKYDIARDTTIRTDYTKLSRTEYMVTCSVVEKNTTLMEISLNVLGEETAMDICRRFHNKSDEIYSALIRTLTTD